MMQHFKKECANLFASFAEIAAASSRVAKDEEAQFAIYFLLQMDPNATSQKIRSGEFIPPLKRTDPRLKNSNYFIFHQPTQGLDGYKYIQYCARAFGF